jgi:hypothetical protein
MFGGQDPLATELSRDRSADEQAEHCIQLHNRIEELKGRPQRRNAAIQRYRLECEPQYEIPVQPALQ